MKSCRVHVRSVPGDMLSPAFAVLRPLQGRRGKRPFDPGSRRLRLPIRPLQGQRKQPSKGNGRSPCPEQDCPPSSGATDRCQPAPRPCRVCDNDNDNAYGNSPDRTPEVAADDPVVAIPGPARAKTRKPRGKASPGPRPGLAANLGRRAARSPILFVFPGTCKGPDNRSGGSRPRRDHGRYDLTRGPAVMSPLQGSQRLGSLTQVRGGFAALPLGLLIRPLQGLVANGIGWRAQPALHGDDMADFC